MKTRALCGLGLALAGCGLLGRSADGTSLERARRERDALRARLEERVAGDPLAGEALAAAGNVVVGLRAGLVQDVIGEVSRRYLDRVVLDLDLGARIAEEGELDVRTFLGKVPAGRWHLDLVVHRVTGTLSAREGEVAFADGGNLVRLAVPVALQGARGRATARFRWDGRSLAQVVCRDFEVQRTLEGRVLADEYRVNGAFRLSAGAAAVRAEPAFPPQSFRIRVDLAPESWAQVRDAIQEQDRVLKCGLALEPEKVLDRLRGTLGKGFDLKLPKALFRPVELPAAVRQRVEVEDRPVELNMRTRELRVTPAAVWYGVDLQAAVGAEAR
jgi:hypothetical protein